MYSAMERILLWANYGNYQYLKDKYMQLFEVLLARNARVYVVQLQSQAERVLVQGSSIF